jgi:hypothetical protein
VYDSGSKRQQRHIPGPFNGLFYLTLAAGAIAAALARVYLAAMRQQLRQCLDVLVINIFFAPAAKATLRLLPRAYVTRFSSAFPLSSYIYHYLPARDLTKKQQNSTIRRIEYSL